METTNNIEQLKENIRQYIKQNGNKEITGQLLQEVLLGMVDGLVGNDAVANPEGEAAEILNKLGIAGTVYTAPQGPQGVSPTVQVTQNENGYHIVITDKDGPHAFDLTNGPANTLSIGTVTDGEHAAASVTGEAPNQQLNLVLPKGEQGNPGQNAVNPFKGWFTTDNIPTTGQAGDYCNVSDTSTTPHTVTIYRWNTTTNQFEDTGEVPDTATGETFASGETLQEVAIDDSHLVNPTNQFDSTKPVLARAEDAQLLMKKIFQANEVDLNSIESANNIISWSNRIWIVGTNNIGSHKCLEVEEGEIVTIIANANYNTHYAILSTDDSTLNTTPSFVTGGELNYITKNTEKSVLVPSGAKFLYLKENDGPSNYLPVSVVIRSSQDLLFANEVEDELDSKETKKPLSANQGRVLDGKIIDLPYTLSNVEPRNVVFDENLPTIPFVIGVTPPNPWYGVDDLGLYTSSYLIRVSAGSKIFVTANSYNRAHIGFLNDFPNPVSGENANLVDSDSLFLIDVDESATITVPVGAKYMCVKRGDGNLYQDRFVPSISTITPIELATKEEIEPFVKVAQPTINPTLYNAIVVNAFIGTSSLNWYLGDNYRSSFIPVNVGDKVHVIAQLGKYVNLGFVSEYPHPQEGVAAPLVGELIRIQADDAVRDISLDVPASAKYLYVKLREGSIIFTPSTLEITPNGSSIIKSYYSEDYEDTYIEEDIFSKTPEKYDENYNSVKWYKIDHTIKDKYKLIIKTTSTAVYLRFADVNRNIMANYDVFSTQTELKVMDNIVIPEGAEYILVHSWLQPSSGYAQVTKGCGALMKPLKYCNDTPKNDYCYCVSKISTIANTPNGYQSGVVYPTEYFWSAWMFRLPKNTNSVCGKPNPIAAFFHGQSGWVSSEQMGYNNESPNTRMLEDLVDAGFIIFDVNGYGVSWQSDEKSMFWGCRMGVDTAKKAYETLVERFNGRRGFFVSGISMGGAIGKSYPMIYPNDVVACALEAPTEIGLTIRSYTASGSTALSHVSIYKAFGYASDADMANDLNRENCIGLSPCVKPLEIDSETGVLKYIGDVMTYDRAYMKEHNDDFYAKFPVEVRVWHSPLDTTANSGVDYEASLLFVNSLRKANCNAILRKVEIPAGQNQHILNLYDWVRQEIIQYAREKMMR